MPDFLRDDELGYRAVRAAFGDGDRLVLDEAYRLAQLPLVDPNHPDALPSIPNADYRHGRYAAPRRSLVIRVPFERIVGHPLFRELRRGDIGRKISWEMFERRRDRLHVTVAALGQRSGPVPPAGFRLRIGGPLIGSRNRGRLYLACYPERVSGGDPLAAMQRACGIAPTGLYLLGVANLVDHLTVAETADLARILRLHEAAALATVEATPLAILATRDDLALDATFTELR